MGNIEFIDGQTVHVSGRLISGAIYHSGAGFKAGRNNIKYADNNHRINKETFLTKGSYGN